MSELDRYGMDDYDYVDETPEPEEITATYAISLDNSQGLNERVGRSRADDLRRMHPMVAVTTVDRGGAYVDIYVFGQDVAVVNTYDYAAGKRKVPFTEDGPRELVMEWIADDLIDYLNQCV